VRRLALVTDSALAPIAEFMAKYVVGVEMRRYPFAEGVADREPPDAEGLVPLADAELVALMCRQMPASTVKAQQQGIGILAPGVLANDRFGVFAHEQFPMVECDSVDRQGTVHRMRYEVAKYSSHCR
jgi:hypothetical protein